MLIDACYAGAMVPKAKGGGSKKSKAGISIGAMERIAINRGEVLIGSSTSKQESWRSSGGISDFTKALLKSISVTDSMFVGKDDGLIDPTSIWVSISKQLSDLGLQKAIMKIDGEFELWPFAPTQDALRSGSEGAQRAAAPAAAGLSTEGGEALYEQLESCDFDHDRDVLLRDADHDSLRYLIDMYKSKAKRADAPTATGGAAAGPSSAPAVAGVGGSSTAGIISRVGAESE